MKDVDTDLEEAKHHAQDAAAKAKDVVDDVREKAGGAADDIWAASEEAAAEAEDAATEGWEDLSGAARSVWSAATQKASDGWDLVQTEIEKRPVRSVVIALAAGFVVGKLFSSRD